MSTARTTTASQVPDTGGAVESGIGLISNDDGSWAYELRGFAKPGDSSWRESHFALYLTGEGGYEGLSGMLWLDPVPGSHWELEGVIAPGPMPEPPAALVPAEPE